MWYIKQITIRIPIVIGHSIPIEANTYPGKTIPVLLAMISLMALTPIVLTMISVSINITRNKGIIVEYLSTHSRRKNPPCVIKGIPNKKPNIHIIMFPPLIDKILLLYAQLHIFIVESPEQDGILYQKAKLAY